MDNNSSGVISGAEIKVFLSYARKDDEIIHFIQPFKDLLTHFVGANSGREISAFVDRHKIEWGDLWKEEIEKSLLSATVFIPILSANYLKSKNCRDEFNTFYSTASKMGVTELILPVLLNRAPTLFTEDSKDEIVQVVLEHQFEIIEDASLTAADSPEWKQTMSQLAGRFNKAYEKAESKLSKLPSHNNGKPEDERGLDEDEEEVPGLLDLMVSVEDPIGEVTTYANQLELALKAITTVASESTPPQGKAATPKQLQLWAIRTADKFKKPAMDIEQAGTRLFSAVQELDKTVGGIKKLAENSEDLKESYQQMVQTLGDLSETRDDLSGLLHSLKSAENMSAAVRRSLKPMRAGITLVQDSLVIMERWKSK